MHWWFEAMDAQRRRQGALMGALLDGLGAGVRESPSRIVFAHPGFQLRNYGGTLTGPVALIVPAPIKRHYLWDLQPGCSVVQRLLEDGMRVYLIEWHSPEEELVQAGLDQYGCEWIDLCLDAISREGADAPVFMFSHSLGGVLAVVHAALRPGRTAGLVLIETPLHFGPTSGAFAAMLGNGLPASALTRNPSASKDGTGAHRLPGSLLSMISVSAAPDTFYAERMADFSASMASRNDWLSHLLVERWTLDELPMAAHLFEQVVEDLYREDRLMQGRLVVDGQSVGPDHVRVPLLAVCDPASRIIPLAAITTFLAAAASEDKDVLNVVPEVGVALSHVTGLVGANAHRVQWPRILAWTRSHARKNVRH